MKTVLIVGTILAAIVWLIAFFNVRISRGGNEERAFNKTFFIIATVVASTVVTIVAYKTALDATISEFDSHLMPYESGVWSLVGTALVFMCGASLPSPVIKLLARYEDDPASLRAAGIEYACEQMTGLAQAGVAGIHVYAMNRPEVAQAAFEALRLAGFAE